MDKRAAIALFLIILLVGVFWGTSRYPTLLQRASLKGDESILGVLSFSAIMPVNDLQPLHQRIFYSTINWLNANRVGMLFAILMAPLAMTFFSFFPISDGGNIFVNSLKGGAMGVPLGVCANCAAPIGKGMYESGFRAETTLAMMISSPTMNIVLLTMILGMFPLKMAIIKIGLNMLLILGVVPLLTKSLRNVQYQTSKEKEEVGWPDALKICVTSALKNLFYIIKTTVPTMVLAGFLGAAAITIIPLSNIQTIGGTVVPMAVLALLCTFLPVPISFDVILAYMLLTLGLAQPMVMVILLTIGTYSIYSFFIIWTTISKKLAIQLFFIVAALGFLGGLLMMA